MKLVNVHSGQIVVGDPRIVNGQVSIGSTDDGDYYRTAILCREDRTESFDIISNEGVLLCRVNVHGHGPWPSVEVISDLEGSIEVNQQGYVLVRMDHIPRPSDTTTIFVYPRDAQR